MSEQPSDPAAQVARDINSMTFVRRRQALQICYGQVMINFPAQIERKALQALTYEH
jgi:hypothetical protein